MSGAFLNADDRDGILIGQTLADKAGLKTGDQFSLSVTNRQMAMCPADLHRARHFFHRTPSYDETTAFLPLAKAQAITGPATTPAPFLFPAQRQHPASPWRPPLVGSDYQVKTFEDMNQLLCRWKTFPTTT